MKCKRRSAIDSTSMASQNPSSLAPFNHTDLIKDILSRLPIKSIKRFESVSKLWCSLINSPDFVSAHLRRAHRRPALLIYRYHNPSSSTYGICLIDSRTGLPCDIRVPFLNPLSRFPKIVASCDGILCLDISSCYATRFVLWNLATMEFRLLPRPLISDLRKPFWMVSTGFGRCSDRNDYKLVRIVHFQCQLDESPLVRAEVFSWATGSWRLIDGSMTDDRIGTCVTHEGQRAVSINGAFYWIASRFADSGSKKCLVCFDLAAEEFRQIAIPEFVGGVCCKVVNFKESLALAVYAGLGRPISRIEVWGWEGDDHANGSTKHWNKLHLVDVNFPGIPIGFYNDAELLLKRADYNCVALSFYDVNTNCYKSLPICGSEFTCEFYSYVESLVPVANGDEHLEEVEEAEVKE